MKISVLCTDPAHPVIPSIRDWLVRITGQGHDAVLRHDRSELAGGDLLFLVSCSQIVPETDREKYRAALVLHASDLPSGRGWSPHVWAILGGAARIKVCLLEASDPVDSGDVWLRTGFELEGHELIDEINALLFDAEIRLMSEAVEKFGSIVPVGQSGSPGTYLRKRTPADSRLDPAQSIAEQFNLLRVVDNERFPAFFEHCGKRYLIRIEKDQNDNS